VKSVRYWLPSCARGTSLLARQGLSVRAPGDPGVRTGPSGNDPA
jgi:hypothetical protein